MEETFLKGIALCIRSNIPSIQDHPKAHPFHRPLESTPLPQTSRKHTPSTDLFESTPLPQTSRKHTPSTDLSKAHPFHRPLESTPLPQTSRKHTPSTDLSKHTPSTDNSTDLKAHPFHRPLESTPLPQEECADLSYQTEYLRSPTSHCNRSVDQRGVSHQRSIPFISYNSSKTKSGRINTRGLNPPAPCHVRERDVSAALRGRYINVTLGLLATRTKVSQGGIHAISDE
nr:uncharacterized protein LOC113828472 [Penaeus vannamei]